jgi:hypothetical protein
MARFGHVKKKLYLCSPIVKSSRMNPPKDITDFLQRIAAQAKLLPKEQAIAVAGCLEHALRGAQEDEWYAIVDSILTHHNQPTQPLLSIEHMNGNINSIEQTPHDYADFDQSSTRQHTPIWNS